jgi:hypothetical protein
MRGGSGSEMAREMDSRRQKTKQRIMHNVGVTSLTHIDQKGGYTAKYLDKILVGVGRSEVGVEGTVVDSKILELELEVFGNLQLRLLRQMYTRRLTVLRQTLMMMVLVWRK